MKNVVASLLVSVVIASAGNSSVYAQVPLLTFGSGGGSDGQFIGPRDAAVDSKGNIYVADESNHRIQKFDRDGSFVGWAGKCTSGPNCDTTNQRSLGFTCSAATCLGLTSGAGDGQFENPFSVAFDNSDSLYVADTGNQRIQVFFTDGRFARKWGSLGSGPGQFVNPASIAVSSSFEVYVADAINHRIQKFDILGQFLAEWGSHGSADGQFDTPTGVAVDSSGTLYVADARNHRIQKFTFAATCPSGTTQVAAGVCFVAKWGSQGSANGQFDEPNDVAVDAVGKVYVADTLNSRLQIFDSSGTFLAATGTFGRGTGQFEFPRGLGVNGFDPFTNIYIADSGNFRAQVFGSPDSDGDGLLDVWETSGIDLNNDGTVDLTLPGADRMHKDVYLETDFMEFHQPPAQAVSNLISAFSNAPVSNPDGASGINLHIQIDDQVVHQNVTNWAGFVAIKQSFFGTSVERSSLNSANTLAAKKLVYHYAAFVHSGFDSGAAEAPGNDLVVSLGDPVDPSNHLSTNLGNFEGVFMHELGHNLGLLHGGGDNINYKPNYLSVMNYWFTADSINFFVQGYARPLDFSRSVLPALDENNLSEPAGIGVTTPPGLYTIYHPTTDVAVGTQISQTGIPIDWNNNGTTAETGVVANVNCNPFGCDALGQKLAGFNDWAALQFSFRTGPFMSAVIQPTGPPEATAQELEGVVKFPVSIDIKPGSFPNTINLGSGGVVPVAILSSTTFDARTIDPASVTLASAPVRLTAKSKLLASFQDVNGDGIVDLIVQVETSALQLSSTDVNAVLHGRTFAGMHVQGIDSVRIVP